MVKNFLSTLPKFFNNCHPKLLQQPPKIKSTSFKRAPDEVLPKGLFNSSKQTGHYRQNNRETYKTFFNQ
jgi:hypothetical protein